MAWWKEQPEDAIKTIHRVIVAMGIEVTKSNQALSTTWFWRSWSSPQPVPHDSLSWSDGTMYSRRPFVTFYRLPIQSFCVLLFWLKLLCLFLFRGFNFVVFYKPHSWANTFCCIPPVIRNFRRCSVARFAMGYFLLQHWTNSWNSLSTSLHVKLCMFGFLILLDSNQNFILDPLRRSFWTESTPDFGSFFRFVKTNLFLRRWLSDSGISLITFGYGQCFLCLQANPTFGRLNKP